MASPSRSPAALPPAAEESFEQEDVEMSAASHTEQLDTNAKGKSKASGKGKAIEGAEEDMSAAKRPRQPAVKKTAQRGTTSLPYSRIQRIMKADKDVEICTREAGFLVSVATELFIHHFAEQAYTVAQMNRRKAVTYKDLADAVAQQWPLGFLKETIPHSMPLSKALVERQTKQEATYAIEAGLIEGDGEDDPEVDVPRQEWVPAIDSAGKVLSQRHSKKTDGEPDEETDVPKRGTARTLSMATASRRSLSRVSNDIESSTAGTKD